MGHIACFFSCYFSMVFTPYSGYLLDSILLSFLQLSYSYHIMPILLCFVQYIWNFVDSSYLLNGFYSYRLMILRLDVLIFCTCVSRTSIVGKSMKFKFTKDFHFSLPWSLPWNGIVMKYKALYCLIKNLTNTQNSCIWLRTMS